MPSRGGDILADLVHVEVFDSVHDLRESRGGQGSSLVEEEDTLTERHQSRNPRDPSGGVGTGPHHLRAANRECLGLAVQDRVGAPCSAQAAMSCCSPMNNSK